MCDIDGSVGRYHPDLTVFVREYWNLPAQAQSAGFMWDGEGNFEDALGITQEQYREAKLAFRQGGGKRFMGLYEDGALAMLWALKTKGCEIWYATSRPWNRLDNVDPDTKFWLGRHEFPIDGIIFDDQDKYGRLVNDHIDKSRIVGVIEDLPEQYDRADELGLPVYQIARQHNSGPTQQRPRRCTMGRIFSEIEENLSVWEA